MTEFSGIKQTIPMFLTAIMLSQSSTVMGEKAGYCEVESVGDVLIKRPHADDAIKYIDDINWFARPVPNGAGDYIVTYASHNQNYLYNLSTGQRIAIPDKSDAVATPDGRFITVPSHYTPDHTVNFYDAEVLLDALKQQEDSSTLKPVFEHRHEQVHNTFYQSAGVLSSNIRGDDYRINYRVMFSGSLPPTPPGFLIADYLVERKQGELSFTPSPVLQLCPKIIGDMGTPFISKDGRYIIAHDNSKQESDATLKLFEVTGVDYEKQLSSCKLLVDFGFRAGKADFSFDNSKITFHLSSNDYITTFIDGGLDAPHITDVVVVELEQDEQGNIIGAQKMSRLTTSVKQGIGNYFPGFFPDGNLFYIANQMPKSHPHFSIGSAKDRRFNLLVIDPVKSAYQTSVFGDAGQLQHAETIGRLWREQCAPHNNPLPSPKSAWHYMSLSQSQCVSLVEDVWLGSSRQKKGLLKTCKLK
jgi:hypothetical protein